MASSPLVLKTPDGKKQLHIIGIEKHTDVVENYRYSVDKPGSIPTGISSSNS
jgi:hypothetical protein